MAHILFAEAFRPPEASAKEAASASDLYKKSARTVIPLEQENDRTGLLVSVEPTIVRAIILIAVIFERLSAKVAKMKPLPLKH